MTETDSDSEFLEMIQFTKHKIAPNDAKMTQNDKKRIKNIWLPSWDLNPRPFFHQEYK